jgi:hypothetical protein
MWNNTWCVGAIPMPRRASRNRSGVVALTARPLWWTSGFSLSMCGLKCPLRAVYWISEKHRSCLQRLLVRTLPSGVEDGAR